MKCFTLVTLFVGSVVTSSVFSAEPESADLRYFRELVETRNYSLGQAVSPQLTPDGKAVVFLRGGARDPVLRLYEFTIAGGSLREILTPEKLLQGAEEKLSAEEKSRRERERQSLRGFTSFELSKDGSKILVALSSKLYVVTRTDGGVTELPRKKWTVMTAFGGRPIRNRLFIRKRTTAASNPGSSLIRCNRKPRPRKISIRAPALRTRRSSWGSWPAAVAKRAGSS